jgi:hypothetical protein
VNNFSTETNLIFTASYNNQDKIHVYFKEVPSLENTIPFGDGWELRLKKLMDVFSQIIRVLSRGGGI